MYVNHLGQPSGPTPQPVLPDIPPAPMPNQLPAWCPKLPKVVSHVCFAYAPAEIAVSRTAAGHVTPDVVLLPATAPTLPGGQKVTIACQYLVIRDFGVDWRHVKPATRNEQLFKDSLARFEADKSLTFRIVGYSDCVGVERNNFLLRRGRARNVYKLFGSSARKRVMAVVAAPAHTYLLDNSTVARRANNRSVVIEIFPGSTGVV